MSLLRVKQSIPPYCTARLTQGEYRVTISPSAIMTSCKLGYTQACDRAEAMAYYTNCPDDAIGTANLAFANIEAAVFPEFHFDTKAQMES